MRQHPQESLHRQAATTSNRKTTKQQEEPTCSSCLKVPHKNAALNPCKHIFCIPCVLHDLFPSTLCPKCQKKAVKITSGYNLDFSDEQRPKEELEYEYTELVGEIVKSEGRFYIGSRRNGNKAGKGTLVYLEEHFVKVYQGTWKNDKREGEGVLTIVDKAIYKGKWVKDDMKKIYEIISLKKGIYQGEMKGFKAHGKGVLEFYNGNTYDGEFVEDRIEGFGKLFYSDEAKYEGEWRNGERDGSGTFKDSYGNIYHGRWKDDNKEGNGFLALRNGDKYDRYEGVWAKDVLQFVSRVYYANEDTYEGEIELENLQKHGEGVLTFKNGDKYEGTWLNDKQHGKGREICRDGKYVFEGVWEEGNMVGTVIMVNLNGKSYKAELKELSWKG